MFEKFTLAEQLERWIRRGWKLSYSGLPDPTGEVVLYRKPLGAESVLDFQILEARRIAGIADCLNRIQLKWGTQVRASDSTPRHSIQRGVKEILGWEIRSGQFELVGIVGPWVHQATVELSHSDAWLTLTVDEEQGEETCFSGTLFCADVTGFELGDQGAYLKAMKDTRWVRLRDLIEERGQDATCLYWSMVVTCLPRMAGVEVQADGLIQYFGPGQHRFLLNR